MTALGPHTLAPEARYTPSASRYLRISLYNGEVPITEVRIGAYIHTSGKTKKRQKWENWGYQK
jgi:hypothetical protein